MITVTAYLKAAKEKKEALKRALEALLQPTWEEKGCLDYDLYSAQKEPDFFVIFEQWEDLETYEAHTKSKHILEFRAIMTNLLDGKTNAPRWDLIGKKQL